MYMHFRLGVFAPENNTHQWRIPELLSIGLFGHVHKVKTRTPFTYSQGVDSGIRRLEELPEAVTSQLIVTSRG